MIILSFNTEMQTFLQILKYQINWSLLPMFPKIFKCMVTSQTLVGYSYNHDLYYLFKTLLRPLMMICFPDSIRVFNDRYMIIYYWGFLTKHV